MNRIARWECLVLLGILVVGAVLRVAYVREARALPDFERPAVDAAFHDYWARGLAFGEWQPRDGLEDPGIRTSPYFRPPGYPYFLAAVYATFGDGYVAPRVVQGLLGLGSVLLAFRFARRRFGRAAGLLLAAAMSVYWPFLFFEAEIQATSLFVFLLLAFLEVTGRWYARRSFLRALAAGIVGGLAALVRPNFLAILAAALVWVVWVRRDGAPWRSTAVAAAGLVAGAALAIAPATIRNAVVSGDFVAISANSGVNLFIGNNPRAEGLVMSEIPGLGDFGTCFDWPNIVRNLGLRLGRDVGDAEANAFFRREAFGFIRDHPRRVAALTLDKALLFWGPREVGHNKEVAYERQFSPVLSRLPGSFPWVLTPGAVGLAWLAWERKRSPGTRRRWRWSVLVALTIGAYFLSVLPFFAAARYRVPVLPLLWLFAAWALARLGHAVLARRFREIAVFVIGFAGLYLLVSRPWVDYEPSLTRWHYDRGVAFDHTGDLDRALRHYKDALATDPTFFHARYNLAHLHMREGRLDDAVTHWEAALMARANYAPTHHNLAILHRKRGASEKAVLHLQHALRLEPGSARYRTELTEALRDLATAHAAAGRFDDAAAAATRALALARASGYDSLARDIEARLQSYRRRARPQGARRE